MSEKKQRLNSELTSNKAKNSTGVLIKPHSDRKIFCTTLKKVFLSFGKFLQFLSSIMGLVLVLYLILQLRAFSSKLHTVFELQNIIGNLKTSVPIVQL